MRIKELTNEEFKQFTSSFPISSIYQTPEYGFVMNGQDYNTLFVGLMDGDNILAASLILITKLNNFKYALAPRGFLMDYSDVDLVNIFTKEIKKFLKSRDVIAIKISPYLVKATYNSKNLVKQDNFNYEVLFNNLRNNGYFHMGYNNYFEALKPRFEAIIDINKPYYELFQSFKKETRTKIRSAINRGVSVYLGNNQHLEYLYLQTKDKYDRPFKYYEDFYSFCKNNNMIDFYYTKLDTSEYLKKTRFNYELCEKNLYLINQQITGTEQTKITKLLNKKMKLDVEFAKVKEELVLATSMIAKYPDGVITSSMLVSKHNDTVRIIIDGYDKRFKSFNSNHLIIWQLIQKYALEGYKKFDLGGVVSPNIPSNEYTGLLTFKRGFNPVIYEYAGDFELITHQAFYFLYKSTTNIKSIIRK